MRIILCIIWVMGPIKIAAININCSNAMYLSRGEINSLANQTFWTIKYVGYSWTGYPTINNNKLAMTTYTLNGDSLITNTEYLGWTSRIDFKVDDNNAIFQSNEYEICGSVTYVDTMRCTALSAQSKYVFTIALVHNEGGVLIFKNCDEDFYWVQISNGLMSVRYNNRGAAGNSESRPSLFSLKKKKSSNVRPADPLDSDIETKFNNFGIEVNQINTPDYDDFTERKLGA